MDNFEERLERALRHVHTLQQRSDGPQIVQAACQLILAEEIAALAAVIGHQADD